MADINSWNKYIGVVQELALVENDLRAASNGSYGDVLAVELADTILFERF